MRSEKRWVASEFFSLPLLTLETREFTTSEICRNARGCPSTRSDLPGGTFFLRFMRALRVPDYLCGTKRVGLPFASTCLFPNVQRFRLSDLGTRRCFRPAIPHKLNHLYLP